jgi:AsmA protein
MNKVLKIVLWVAGLAVVLLVAAVIILPLVLDPNDFRDDISGAVSSRTGHELTIEGDLELSVLPFLGVEIGRTSLSNAPGFGDQPLLAIDGAAVGVRLMPLLSRRLEVSKVTLDGLRLNLVRDEQGSANWDGLVAAEEAQEESAAPPDGTAEQSFDLNEVAGISLTDAQIVFDDRQAGEHLQLELEEFASGRISGGMEKPSIDGLEVQGASLAYAGGEAGQYDISLGSLSTGLVEADPDAPVIDGIEAQAVAASHDAGPEDRYRISLGQFRTGRVVANAEAPVVDGLAIVDADVDYTDAEGRYTTKLAELTTGNIGGTAETPEIGGIELADATIGVESSDGSRMEALITALTTGRIVGDQAAPQIESLELQDATLGLSDVDGNRTTATLAALKTGRIVGDQKAPEIGGIELSDAAIVYNEGAADSIHLDIPDFTIGSVVPGSDVPISGNVKALLADPALAVVAALKGQASADGPKMALANLELALDVEGDTVPEGKQSGVFRVKRLDVNQDAQTMALEGVVVDVAGLKLNANANGEQIIDAPVINGRVTIAEFSPRDLMNTFGIEVPVTADPAVLGKASLETRFRSAEERIGMSALKVQLDDTLLTGNLSATTGESTTIKGKIHVDDIDLDRYMAPETDTEQPASGPTEIPSEDLRAQNANVSLTMGRVKAAGLRLENVDATLALRRGSLRVTPMTADFYGGRLEGLFALTTREEPPRMKLKQTLTDVNVEPLFRDLAEVDSMTGTAKLNIDVSAIGQTSDQMISNLDGRVGFRVQDGVLRGINITWELQRALALIKQRSAPQKTSEDTTFKNISGKGVLAKGILTNDDLAVAAPGLKLTGAGTVDLNQEQINYDLVARVPKGRQATQAGLDDLVGKNIPVKISGSLDDPSVRPDLGKLIGDEVSDFLKKQLGLGKDKNKDQEGEGADGEEKEDGNDLEDALKNLLGK